MLKKTQIYLYQIYYDAYTKQNLSPGFIPLDNSSNLRPDWMELWVIRNFLNQYPLDADTWYGFFSPKFTQKTSLNYKQVKSALDRCGDDVDVALFSHSWDILAYYQNSFESGDLVHPGLLDMTQEFLESIGSKIKLMNYVDDSRSACFSNYIVAKKSYWDKWLGMANLFFEYVESRDKILSKKFLENTFYSSSNGPNPLPMKIFIQERFPSIIISTNKFKVANIDLSRVVPLSIAKPSIVHILQACDTLKYLYRNSSDLEYLKMYQKIRGEIFKDRKINAIKI